MNNKIAITIISVIAIVAFLFGAYKLTNVPVKSDYPEVNVLTKTDHITWSPDKKNILVEYSDLQCPACQNFHTLIKSQIQNTSIPKKVTFVYRHFPLTNAHAHAEEAALSAEAAGMQGKFFEYTDVLFVNQLQWANLPNATNYFEKVAKDLKLDIEKFKKDRISEAAKNKVTADVLSGTKANLNATPTFYLNGQKLDSVRSFDEFKQLLSDLK